MSNIKSVLIADDQSSIRSLVKMIINDHNAEVVAEAENGYDAVEKYRQYKPDLALLDINMPVMDGIEALEKILKEFPDAKVAMLTSQNTMDVVKKCAGLGAKYFVLKNTAETITTELKKLL